MKFDITSRWGDRVLFSADIKCGENERYSVKLGLAVRAAVKAGVSLVGANLAHASLAGVSLTGVSLTGVSLTGASLVGADLVDVNLIDADLARANLARASLVGANLARASLVNAYMVDANLANAYMTGAKWRDDITLTRAPIQICNIPNGWSVTILDQHMQIGCELHAHEDWAAFDDRRILEMSGKRALAFWRANRDWLIAACTRHAGYS